MNTNDGRELVMRRADDASMPGLPDRAAQVATWFGWHLFEIGGVSVPAVAAVTVTPWAWLVSTVVGAGWTVHEVRTARAQAAIRAGRDLPAVATVPAGPVDGIDQGDESSDTDPVTGRTGTEGGAR
jgi:hypothetical protein